jgi:hypothetical protein
MGFSGDLDDLPLQDILYVLSSKGKSGLLTLQTRSHDISLMFDRGSVVSVTTSDGSLRIGHLLVAQGYVTDEQIEDALGLQAVNPDSARIGDLLVDVGYVTREQIQDAVNAQLEASIFRILVQVGGTFTFEPSESVVPEPIATGIRLESMVLNAMRLADEWRSVHNPDNQLRLSDTVIDSMIVDQLDAHERAIVLSILNGDSTVDVLGLRTTLSAAEFKEARDRLIQRRLITVHSLGRSAEEVPA